MAPTSQASTNTDINNAYQQGQQLQNMYNTQSGQAQGQYNSSVAGANNAQGQLQNYTNQIASTNYGNVYGQDLSQAQNMYGFNPQDLLKANQNLATTQTTLANLPQAIQQQGNGYGTLAGSEASNYANQAGNLNTTLAGQGNAVNAYQSVLAATQQQANQQTTQQLAGQQQALGGYQSAAQNATSIMQQSQLAMNNIETLAQQQGGATASQVAAYQNAYSQYISAQAAAASAAAAQTTAGATAGLDAAQVAQINQQIQLAKQANSQASTSGTLTVKPLSNPISLSVNKPSNSSSVLGNAGINIQGGGL